MVPRASQELDGGGNVLHYVANRIRSEKSHRTGECLCRPSASATPGCLRRILRRFSPARRSTALDRFRHGLQTFATSATRFPYRLRALSCSARLHDRFWLLFPLPGGAV